MGFLSIVRTGYHGPTDTRGTRISASFTDRFTGKSHRIMRSRDLDVEPLEQRTLVAVELITTYHPEAKLVGNDGDTYAFLVDMP